MLTDHKRRYIKAPPELGDGTNYSVFDPNDHYSMDALKDAVAEWCVLDGTTGEELTLEIVEMTQEEVDQLPEL